jgi:hypothetical protein
VVDVAHGADVDVWLGALELLLAHLPFPSRFSLTRATRP